MRNLVEQVSVSDQPNQQVDSSYHHLSNGELDITADVPRKCCFTLFWLLCFVPIDQMTPPQQLKPLLHPCLSWWGRRSEPRRWGWWHKLWGEKWPGSGSGYRLRGVGREGASSPVRIYIHNWWCLGSAQVILDLHTKLITNMLSVLPSIQIILSCLDLNTELWRHQQQLGPSWTHLSDECGSIKMVLPVRI